MVVFENKEADSSKELDKFGCFRKGRWINYAGGSIVVGVPYALISKTKIAIFVILL